MKEIHPSGPAVFLSPHFDDVALSCGGTAALVADSRETVAVVTVFGGEVTDEVLSPFARWKHARWGTDGIDRVIEQRRAEDRAAAEVLGCDSVSLGFPDAIYRGDRYSSDQGLFQGRPTQEEERLVDMIAGELSALPLWKPPLTLFVPLGAGGHVDHCLAFLAGCRLAGAGVAVLAYEDCPYVIHTPGGLDRRLEEVGAVLDNPVMVDIEQTLERRLRAISAYRSQLPVIFRFTDDFRAAVTRFATCSGGGCPVERFWPLRPGVTH